MLDAARRQWECFRFGHTAYALMVTRFETIAWVCAVVAAAALLMSMRTPRLGSRLGWVYPPVIAVASVAVLVVDAAWWLTRTDPRAAVGAGVAGLWLWGRPRESELGSWSVIVTNLWLWVQSASATSGSTLETTGSAGQRAGNTGRQQGGHQRLPRTPSALHLKHPAGPSLDSPFSWPRSS
jgi:hypothetical protein